MPNARTILAAVCQGWGCSREGRRGVGVDLGPVSIFDFISELTSEMRRLVVVVVVVIHLITMHERYSPVIRIVVVIVQCCHASHVP